MAGPRVDNRKKRRMPCELQVGSRSHSGLVIDLSASGLFVQTNAKTKAGEAIDLTVSPGKGEPIALRVEVVRKKMVPPRLLAVAGGGLGVRILEAPDTYYDFLRELGIQHVPGSSGSASDGGEAGSFEATTLFHVRVAQVSGSRSRRVDVSATDEAAAAEAALATLDEGWKVLGVEAR